MRIRRKTLGDEHPETLTLARLLCKQGSDKDKAENNGATPLCLASAEGHLDIVRLLCKQGSDKDKATDAGMTPLFLACAEGRLEMVQLLCDKGSVNTVNG